MNYYKPKYFLPQELVSKGVYKALRARSFLVMDYYMLKTIDTIREWFDCPIAVNNWLWGGKFQNRGFRSRWCRAGSKWSQHRFGRAIDFDVKGLKASKARREILDNQSHFPHITAMERGVNWVHIDCRPVVSDKIVLFNP